MRLHKSVSYQMQISTVILTTNGSVGSCFEHLIENQLVFSDGKPNFFYITLHGFVLRVIIWVSPDLRVVLLHLINTVNTIHNIVVTHPLFLYRTH